MSIYSSQHLLDGIYSLFLEQRFPTLLAYPGRHIIDDKMISLPGGRIADGFADQRSPTIEALHIYPFLRVRQSDAHCSTLGKYAVMTAR